MTNLCKLGISLFQNSRAWRLLHFLEKLENLEDLKLEYYRYRYLNFDRLSAMHRITRLKLHGGTPFPPPKFPPNLIHLSLILCSLNYETITSVQSLPKLVHLKLNDSFEGREMVISRDGFPALKVLYLRSMSKLKTIRLEEGGMPELRRLEIVECTDLESLPEEMKQLAYLEELKIVASTEIARKVGGVDSDLISNIPYVIHICFHVCNKSKTDDKLPSVCDHFCCTFL